MIKQPKVIVVGLDGATWDLIKPLAVSGKLPTFNKLMKESAWGGLESTIPATTFPAWESIFTGQNPGKLGVFNFTDVDVKRKKFSVNTPSSFDGMHISKILNKYSYTTCMINIPTSKVQKVDGVIVGGPFSDQNLVYPPDFKKVLDEMDYQHYPGDLTKAFMDASNKEPSLDLIKKTISSRFKLADFMIEHNKPDFLALVVFIVDNIQHFYWSKELVYKTWEIIDENLGEFISKYNDSTIVLVSDHGFTGFNKTFYLSKFLEKEDLITYKSRNTASSKYLFRIKRNNLINLARKTGLDRLLLKLFSKKQLQFLFSSFPSDEGRVGLKRLKNIIDWEHTKCVPMSGNIYFCCGESEKEGLKHMLRTRLEGLEGIVKKVHFKEDIYWGECLDRAPDLVVEPEKGIRILESPFADEMITKQTRKGWMGVHAPKGIFLFHGPNIRKTRADAKIYDIAPTILSLYGICDTHEMDGKILEEIVGSCNEKDVEKNRLKKRIRKIRNKI